MPNTIPQMMLGQHVSLVTVRYQLAAASGLLGNGASALQTLTAIVDGIQKQGRNNAEQIQALTASLDNMVHIETDDALVLTEIMQDGADPTTVPQLAALKYNTEGAEHVIAIITRAGGTFTFVSRIGRYSASFTRSKCTASLVMDIVDIIDTVPVTNPSYT